MARLKVLSVNETALATKVVGEFLTEKGQDGADMFRMVKLAFAFASGESYYMRLNEDFHVAFHPDLYPPLRIISKTFNEELTKELQGRLKVVLEKFNDLEKDSGSATTVTK